MNYIILWSCWANISASYHVGYADCRAERVNKAVEIVALCWYFHCVRFFFSSYPLLKLPLPGNAPLQFITPTEGYSVPPAAARLEELSGESGAKRPRWVSWTTSYVYSVLMSVWFLFQKQQSLAWQNICLYLWSSFWFCFKNHNQLLFPPLAETDSQILLLISFC